MTLFAKNTNWPLLEQDESAYAIFRLEPRGIYAEQCSYAFRQLVSFPEEVVGCSSCNALKKNWGEERTESFSFSVARKGVWHTVRLEIRGCHIFLSILPECKRTKKTYSGNQKTSDLFVGLLFQEPGNDVRLRSVFPGTSLSSFQREFLSQHSFLKARAKEPCIAGKILKIDGTEYVGILLPLGSVSVFLCAPAKIPNKESVVLTPRESEMLALAARGDSNRAIAFSLHVSEGTVKKTLSNAYHKCFISSRIDLLLRSNETVPVFP